VLKKIQAAGKLIQISIIPEDLDILLEELKPEGVHYSVYSYDLNTKYTEQDAKDLIKKVEASHKRKFY
jgi:hypothetical protein